MRIRGKKPWALIKRKIVRFRSQEEFDHWSDNDLRKRIEETDKLSPEDFYTSEQVWEHIEQHAKQRKVYLQVTRRPRKKKIRKRRLWPA